MTARPLAELVDDGWAKALEPVADQVAAMGDFLRGELAVRPPVPAGGIECVARVHVSF